VPPAGGTVTKTNVLAPPDLAEPLNLQPLIVPDPKHAPVHFEWKPVPEAISYEIRVSTTSMFSRIVEDRKLAGTSVDISGLDPGDYFWDVMATDALKTRQRGERYVQVYARDTRQRPGDGAGNRRHRVAW